MKNKKECFILIICDLIGKIEEVVIDNTNIFEKFKNNLMTRLVDGQSFSKAANFFLEVKKKGTVSNYHMNIEIEGVLNELEFYGILKENKIIVVAVSKFDTHRKYFEEMISMNTEYSNLLRDLLQQNKIAEEIKIDRRALNEMTHLNNELVNLQRELMNTNWKIENEKEKLKMILQSIAEGVVVLSKEHLIEDMNPAAMRLFNANEQDFGKDISGYCSKIDFSTISQEKDISDFEEIMISNKSGSYFVDVTISPIYIKGVLINRVMTIKDVTQRIKEKEKLKRFAYEDNLTKILNRRAGLQELGLLLKKIEIEPFDLTICYIDIDGLKEANDLFGHDEGDKLLKGVAQIFRKNVRDADLLCRIGGDEFLIILPHCDRLKAEEIWKRILIDFELKNEKMVKSYKYAASHGIIQYEPSFKSNVIEFITKADKLMYKEKSSKKMNISSLI